MAIPDPLPDAPLEGFFLRMEKAATAAFHTIPFVGGHVAEFFNEVVVPYCTPGRNRILRRCFGGLRRLEGGLQIILIRLMPLPGPAEERPPGSR
jgi:hypothetical protein